MCVPRLSYNFKTLSIVIIIIIISLSSSSSPWSLCFTGCIDTLRTMVIVSFTELTKSFLFLFCPDSNSICQSKQVSLILDLATHNAPEFFPYQSGYSISPPFETLKILSPIYMQLPENTKLLLTCVVKLP